MTQQPQSGCMFLVLYEYNTNSRSKKTIMALTFRQIRRLKALISY